MHRSSNATPSHRGFVDAPFLCWQRSTARIALVVLASGFLLLVARNQFLTGDPTYYIGLAESLAAGRGYTFMGQPHTHYPPGLSLLLLPFVSIVGQDVLVAQLVVAVFAPLALVAILFFTRVFDPRAELIVGFLLVFAYSFFSLATRGVRTELPYLAVTACALGLLLDPRAARRPAALAIIAASSAAAVLLRSIGIALPVALFVTWAHRRLRRQQMQWIDRSLLVGGLAGLAVVACWVTWVASNASGSYLTVMLMDDPHQADLGQASVGSIVSRFPRALVSQIVHLGELVTGLGWLLPTWLSPITVALASSLGVGLWLELQRPAPVLAWYVAAYGGILLVWPFDEVRFTLPIFPLLLLIGWRGATWIAGRFLAEANVDQSSAVPPCHRSVKPRAWLALAIIGLLFGGMTAAGVGGFPTSSRQGLVIAASWWVVVGMGTYFSLTRRSIRVRPWILAATFCFLAGYALLNTSRIAPQAVAHLMGRDTSDNAALRPGIEWLGRHVGTNDVVMAEIWSSVHFYTGLRAVPLPMTGDRQVLASALLGSGARYILIRDDSEFPYYRPTETERLELLRQSVGTDRFELAHRFSTGAVYRVR